MPWLGGRYVASLMAVGFIAFFAFYRIDGQPAGLALWALFGSTNQVLAGLTLLTVTVYLKRKGWNYWYTFIPMVFMLVVTVAAMLYNITSIYLPQRQLLLLGVGGCVFVLSVWLAMEAVLRFRKGMVPAARGGE
jgi:carbon starvation protein